MLAIDRQKGHIVTYDNHSTSKGEHILRVKGLAVAGDDSARTCQETPQPTTFQTRGYRQEEPLEWSIAMELADQERDIYNTESSWSEVFVKAIRTSPQYNSARSQIDRHINRSGSAGMSAFVQSRLRNSRKFNGYITPRNGRFFTHQEVTKYPLVKFHDL